MSNVVQFPTQQRSPQEDKLAKELEANGGEAVLRRLEENRKKGLEKLEEKIYALEEQPICASSEVESLKRDVLSAAKSILISAEALDNYSSLLAHDISFLGAKQDKMGFDLFQTGAHVQALMAVLEEKGVATADDIKNAWNRIVPEAVAEVQKVVRGEGDQA